MTAAESSVSGSTSRTVSAVEGRLGLGATAQISFTWSKGSRQAVQRYCALQAVEPNSETSSVAGESHCGQRTWRAVGSRVSGIGPDVDGRRAGRGDAGRGERGAALRA